MQGKEKGDWWLMVKVASSSIRSQGGECCNWLQNCEVGKTWNRDTICEACHDFCNAVSMFCRVSNRDTILGKRDTIFGLLGKFSG